jgi:hypothetical protein
MRPRLALVALAVMLSACKTVEIPVAPGVNPQVQQVVDDRLYFGRNIPAGGFVSDADWENFLRTVVTPSFPQGFTVFQGNGQWLDQRGTIAKEQGFMLEVHHAPSAHADSLIAAIALEYKKRFRQDAVLRATNPATIRFY